MPLALTLLHALRIGADPRSGSPGEWLAVNGIGRVDAKVQALSTLLGDAAPLAPPGEPFPRPIEQVLLEALARVDHDPEGADRLLDFLPEEARVTGLALLAEISRDLSAALFARLKHPTSMHDPMFR